MSFTPKTMVGQETIAQAGWKFRSDENGNINTSHLQAAAMLEVADKVRQLLYKQNENNRIMLENNKLMRKLIAEVRKNRRQKKTRM